MRIHDGCISSLIRCPRTQVCPYESSQFPQSADLL